MPRFTSLELEAMRDIAEEYMQDTCIIQRYSRTFNSIGEPVAAYTADLTTTRCGLEQGAGGERHTSEMSLVTWDAVLRLPYDTELNEKDRIEITKRYEYVETTIVYEVAAPIQRGPTAIRVKLSAVQV